MANLTVVGSFHANGIVMLGVFRKPGKKQTKNSSASALGLILEY